MTTPPNQSPQSQAIACVNLILLSAQQMYALYQQIEQIDATWADDAVATTIANWQTVSVTIDGSLATTSDVAINPAHPFNPTLYPTLTRPVSANLITQVKTVLDNLVTYMNGQAVSAVPGARAVINEVIGG